MGWTSWTRCGASPKPKKRAPDDSSGAGGRGKGLARTRGRRGRSGGLDSEFRFADRFLQLRPFMLGHGDVVEEFVVDGG